MDSILFFHQIFNSEDFKDFFQISEEKKKVQVTSSLLVPAPLNLVTAIVPTSRKNPKNKTDGFTLCSDSPEPLYSSHSGMHFSMLLWRLIISSTYWQVYLETKIYLKHYVSNVLNSLVLIHGILSLWQDAFVWLGI